MWMRMVGQLRHADYRGVFMLKYAFYQWTRQRIHNTLIVVDQYLRLMGDKMIPDSVQPGLEAFYPPFIAGIELPHQGEVDSYNLQCVSNGDTAVLHWAIDMLHSQGLHIKVLTVSLHLKSLRIQLFVDQLVHNKFTDHQWIPLTKGQ